MLSTLSEHPFSVVWYICRAARLTARVYLNTANRNFCFTHHPLVPVLRLFSPRFRLSSVISNICRELQFGRDLLSLHLLVLTFA